MSGLTLAEMAVDVLTTADSKAKIKLSRAHAAHWFEARQTGEIIEIGAAQPPDFPARPDAPELLSPGMCQNAKPARRRAASPYCTLSPISN